MINWQDLKEEVTVEELERTECSLSGPFGKDADLWDELKRQMLSGDKIYRYRTNLESWRQFEGRSGVALVRGTEIVYYFCNVHT